jgi:hypothetical protein
MGLITILILDGPSRRGARNGHVMRNRSGALISKRKGSQVLELYAVITRDPDGTEGVIRRDTPMGTQPWITDDAVLARKLLEAAVEHWPDATLICFKRV